MKKIGILTSGGDCGGLNAVIRAVTFRAINEYGWRVFGIKDGTLGLIRDPLDIIELNLFVSIPLVLKIVIKIIRDPVVRKKKYKSAFFIYLLIIPPSINASILPFKTDCGFVSSILFLKSFTSWYGCRTYDLI